MQHCAMASHMHFSTHSNYQQQLSSFQINEKPHKYDQYTRCRLCEWYTRYHRVPIPAEHCLPSAIWRLQHCSLWYALVQVLPLCSFAIFAAAHTRGPVNFTHRHPMNSTELTTLLQKNAQYLGLCIFRPTDTYQTLRT